jgi:hypothetical protein
MKKLYILAPLVALALFIVYYLNFAKEYEATEEAQRVAEVEARKKAQLKEIEDRKKAVQDALVMQEQRKAERAEKEAKDLAEKEARQAAVDARDRAYRDQDKLGKQVERLKKEIETVKSEIAEVEKEKQRSVEEEAHLRQYVSAAEANVRSLQQVLEKIEAADKARAAAEAAAAAAAKKS